MERSDGDRDLLFPEKAPLTQEFRHGGISNRFVASKRLVSETSV